MSRQRSAIRITVYGLCLALLLGIVCLALPRYPSVAPRSDSYPAEALGTQIDPWLLGDGFGKRTVVEIDWIEGCKPGPQTTAGLEAILKKYSPQDRSIAVVRDEEIPRAEWDALESEPDR